MAGEDDSASSNQIFSLLKDMDEKFDSKFNDLVKSLTAVDRRIDEFEAKLTKIAGTVSTLDEIVEERLADETAFAQMVAEASEQEKQRSGSPRALVSGDPAPTSQYLVTRDDDLDGQRTAYFGS